MQRAHIKITESNGGHPSEVQEVGRAGGRASSPTAQPSTSFHPRFMTADPLLQPRKIPTELHS